MAASVQKVFQIKCAALIQQLAAKNSPQHYSEWKRNGQKQWILVNMETVILGWIIMNSEGSSPVLVRKNPNINTKVH